MHVGGDQTVVKMDMEPTTGDLEANEPALVQGRAFHNREAMKALKDVCLVLSLSITAAVQSIFRRNGLRVHSILEY